MDIVAFLDQQRVVSGSSWVVVFCFREVHIRIGKLNGKFDEEFLTEGLWGRLVVEVVGMYSAF